MVIDTTSLRVQLIAKLDSGMTGTSRYSADLHQALRRAGMYARLTFPQPPPTFLVKGLDRLGLDLRAFLASYPLRACLDPADLYHITTQTMATLLWTQRFPAPMVVTVLDIIPHLVRGDPELVTSRHIVERLFYRLALSGLRRADALIAISEYTKRTLVEALGLQEERIHVVYPAVDHARFRPLDVPAQFRARYGLHEGWRYVLYVGSDDPRKNLSALVQAFALLIQQVDGVRLLLVGQPQFPHHRKRLLELAAELGIEDAVQFLDVVPDDDLPLFYNVADLFAMPSLYEGFGLSVAEAMACGLPIVCSNRCSLPEAAGDAALLFDPASTDGLGRVLAQVLEDQALAVSMREEGLKRSKMFTLERSANRMVKAYSLVCDLGVGRYR